MSDSGSTGAGWFGDPHGRHELRWYDGTRWTGSVSDQGQTSTDPVDEQGRLIATEPAPTAVAADPADAAPTAARPDLTTIVNAVLSPQAAITGDASAWAAPGGELFAAPLIVVNQTPQLLDATRSYDLFDATGVSLGAVREVGQSMAKKAISAFTTYDRYMSHSFDVTDQTGAVRLKLVRPGKVLKSKINVTDGAGNAIGTIVQQNVIGKIRFGLEVNGQAVGMIKGENWRRWDFSIRDAADTEVAHVSRSFPGLMTQLFTDADNYVVRINEPVPEPLRSLVIAAAVSIDTALRNEDRGVGNDLGRGLF